MADYVNCIWIAERPHFFFIEKYFSSKTCVHAYFADFPFQPVDAAETPTAIPEPYCDLSVPPGVVP